MPQEGEMTDQNDTDSADEQIEDVDTQDVQDTDSEDRDTDTDDAGFDASKAAEKIRKINSENRNLRKRAQEAEEKAKDADGKDKTITDQASEILRLRIAVKHGLPEQLVKRLTGTTEEEILQDAEELMELFGSKAPPTNRPKEKLRSPGDPAGSADVDVEKVVDRVFQN